MKPSLIIDILIDGNEAYISRYMPLRKDDRFPTRKYVIKNKVLMQALMRCMAANGPIVWRPRVMQ